MVPFLASDFARICLCLHLQNLLISTEIGKPISLQHMCMSTAIRLNWSAKSLIKISFLVSTLHQKDVQLPLGLWAGSEGQPSLKATMFWHSSGEERGDSKKLEVKMAAKPKVGPVTGRELSIVFTELREMDHGKRVAGSSAGNAPEWTGSR